jgi:ABC-2 type transport system permease protein
VTHLAQVRLVAVWEFRRYFKWKDQLIGLVVFLVMSGLFLGAGAVAGAKGREVTLGVEGFAPESSASGRLRFVPAPPGDSARREALAEGRLRGIVTRRPDGGFDLRVAKDPRYRTELATWLTDLVRRERLAATGLTSVQLERLLAPAPLAVRYDDPSRAGRGAAEKVAAAVCVGLLVIAVFTAMAYTLTSITSEKQLRVTESVLSAIPPQAWIDGKVLGLTGYALTVVANMVVGSLLLAVVAGSQLGFAIPRAAVRPGVLAGLLLFVGLGLLLWNAFFAAVAATIDDPNTSSRGSLLMLPLLPVVMSLAVVSDPDSVVARVLALFPLTSAPAMPVRMVLSDPGVAEILGSVLLLLGGIWAMRRLAGRIFEVGMLMYGKEAALREVMRWAAQPSRRA